MSLSFLRRLRALLARPTRLGATFRAALRNPPAAAAALFGAFLLSPPLPFVVNPAHAMPSPNAPMFFPSGPEARLETAILADDPAAVDRALAAGAKVDARGLHNGTPLMVAVSRGRARAVAALLRAGAHPNLVADDHVTAVFLAIEHHDESPEGEAILDAVMAAGGDPNTRRPDDDPVLVRFLFDHRCDRIRWMKSLGANLDLRTRTTDPLILYPARGADWDLVLCLLELGADPFVDVSPRPGLARLLATRVPSPDSPIYPAKKKVWQILHDRGMVLKPLPP